MVVIKTNCEPTALTDTCDMVLAWSTTSDWNACPSSGRDMLAVVVVVLLLRRVRLVLQVWYW